MCRRRASTHPHTIGMYALYNLGFGEQELRAGGALNTI